MPYDPNLPVEGTECDAVQMRAQLTGLDDKITAISSVTGAVVTNTTTGAPGSGAAVAVQFAGGVLQFQFTVPEGPQGVPGEVSQSQLSNELSNVSNFAIGQATSVSSNNSNAVQTLDNTMVNAEAEALRVKLNELLLALRR